MHAEFPVGAFIAAVLVLVPLPSHWRARNVATLSMIVWLFVSNVIYAVDSIIWAGNVLDSAPIWCDIGRCRLLHPYVNYLTIQPSNEVTDWCQHGTACVLPVHLHSSGTYIVGSAGPYLPP